MSASTNQSPIPVTDFYGESTAWPVEDRVHCEQLSLRSALYDWQIKAHRHRDLMQLFFVQEGQGAAQVDHRSLVIHSGDLLVIPEQCVHTFRWEAGSNGYVIAIARPLINRLEKLLDAPSWLSGVASLFKAGKDKTYLSALFTLINDEYSGRQLYRQILLENRVLSLGIWVTRQHALIKEADEPQKGRSEKRLKRFLDLLEEYFQTRHSVDWYADKVGITAAHLNEVCKKLRDQTALKVIHQRLLTEAQRDLIYTGKTAADIALSLGFSDPAYFNRFFKRMTGQTPRNFRSTKSPG